jgi:hypothetical protein
MMRPARLLATMGASLAIAAALSCGEVPTLAGGVAYISGVVSPSLAVAAGDTLRDSLGDIAPLRVYAFGRESDTLPGIPVSYLVTSLDTGVKIDAAGVVAVSDSVRAVRIVGQALGALQTPELTLQVVPQPDSIQRTPVNDSIRDTLGVRLSQPLDVTVTGLRRGTRAGVPFIVVTYQIDSVTPAPGTGTLPDTSFLLADDQGRFSIRTPRIARDTTDASGQASRRVRVSTNAFDRVYVRVTARNLKGEKLRGSPATWVLVRGF